MFAKKGGNIKSAVIGAAGAKSIASKAPAKESGRMSTGNGPYSAARVPIKARLGKGKSGHESE